jgi:hypothetical protein
MSTDATAQALVKWRAIALPYTCPLTKQVHRNKEGLILLRAFVFGSENSVPDTVWIPVSRQAFAQTEALYQAQPTVPYDHTQQYQYSSGKNTEYNL